MKSFGVFEIGCFIEQSEWSSFDAVVNKKIG